MYCAAYNNSFGFLKDEIANWALIGDNIGYFSTYSGAWTDFIITGSGSIYITANVDGHGNLTGLLSITALLPDLEITAVDITFSPDDSELEQKKATLVDILVRNLGGTANLVCSVDVYDVRPPNDDIIKIYSYSLGPFYAYQTLSFNFTWTPTVIGTHGILVLLDADNKIIESLESNNQAERTIEVVPFVPDLVDIEVEPKSTKIEAGEVFQFLAYGIFEDESSLLLLENEVRWNATGGASVNSTGHFHSLKSGSYNITASSSSIGKSRIKNTSKAYVEPGPLEYIEVYPTIIDLDVGMSKKFSAKGFDQYYNEVPISPSWRVTGGGKINQVGEFRAEDEGSWKVIAEVLNINGSATVRVNPVTLDIEKLMLFPSKLVILINHDYRFNAIGADSKGNEHSVQPLWSTTGGGELDLNGIFNATTEGRWTITASFGEFKATSEVIVVTRSSQEHLESFFDPRTGISVTASFLGTGTILINRVDIFDMFMTSPANMVTLGMFIEIIATANMVINWARIFMPYNPNNIPSENSDLESSLKLYTWSEAEKSWTETDQSGVNLNNKIVYGNVSHLSVFAPMVQLSKPVKDDDGISNSTIAAIFLTIFIPVIFVIFVIMNKKGVSFSPFGRQGGRDRMVKPIVVIRHKRQIRREIDEDEELEE